MKKECKLGQIARKTSKQALEKRLLNRGEDGKALVRELPERILRLAENEVRDLRICLPARDWGARWHSGGSCKESRDVNKYVEDMILTNNEEFKINNLDIIEIWKWAKENDIQISFAGNQRDGTTFNHQGYPDLETGYVFPDMYNKWNSYFELYLHW